MTRAQFWGEKIVRADKLSQETVRHCWDAAQQEIVKTEKTSDGVTLHWFEDGSLLRASPIDVLNNQWGHLEWSTE